MDLFRNITESLETMNQNFDREMDEMKYGKSSVMFQSYDHEKPVRFSGSEFNNTIKNTEKEFNRSNYRINQTISRSKETAHNFSQGSSIHKLTDIQTHSKSRTKSKTKSKPKSKPKSEPKSGIFDVEYWRKKYREDSNIIHIVRCSDASPIKESDANYNLPLIPYQYDESNDKSYLDKLIEDKNYGTHHSRSGHIYIKYNDFGRYGNIIGSNGHLALPSSELLRLRTFDAPDEIFKEHNWKTHPDYKFKKNQTHRPVKKKVSITDKFKRNMAEDFMCNGLPTNYHEALLSTISAYTDAIHDVERGSIEKIIRLGMSYCPGLKEIELLERVVEGSVSENIRMIKETEQEYLEKGISPKVARARALYDNDFMGDTDASFVAYIMKEDECES